MSGAGTKGVPREQRERQILDIATAEFGSHGYANASLVDIATAAGVSKPLIYTYFGSRDGLHAACVQDAGESLVEAVARAQAVPGAQGKALATLTGIFHALDGRTQNWRIIYDSTLPRPSPAYERARAYQDALNTMGSDGVAEVLGGAGSFDREDHSLLLSWWFGIVSTTISWWSDHPGDKPADMADRCLRLLTAIRAGSAS
ncbi:TetR/AcrR family transcriptional regulator [Nocardia sp. NPDC051832]|uniref:TetR/AcrR family transcriptional regulator n=1 Tax=Nocardia sp. NPDC051832 TaxID=3155673 RepID=UPI003447EAF1